MTQSEQQGVPPYKVILGRNEEPEVKETWEEAVICAEELNACAIVDGNNQTVW